MEVTCPVASVTNSQCHRYAIFTDGDMPRADRQNIRGVKSLCILHTKRNLQHGMPEFLFVVLVAAFSLFLLLFLFLLFCYSCSSCSSCYYGEFSHLVLRALGLPFVLLIGLLLVLMCVIYVIIIVIPLVIYLALLYVLLVLLIHIIVF